MPQLLSVFLQDQYDNKPRGDDSSLGAQRFLGAFIVGPCDLFSQLAFVDLKVRMIYICALCLCGAYLEV